MISLVVATYNRNYELKRFLCSLSKSYWQYEVLIVDQNDEIDLSELISEFSREGMDIHHLQFNKKNLSAARNFGISKSKYEYVGFPDDDCWYDNGTITALIANTNTSETDILVARWYEEDYAYPSHQKRIETIDILNMNSIPIPSITLFFKREVLIHLNGFVEYFGVGLYFGAGEETDLLIRAAIEKFEIGFCPDIMVHHKYSKTTLKNNNFREIRRRERSVGAIYFKNRLNFRVIIRGFSSPLFKLIFYRNTKLYYNQFCGRLEGSVKWIFLRFLNKV